MKDFIIDEFITESHALWTTKSEHKLSIDREVDKLLAGYLFYPEPEYPIYNIRPPETHTLLGAWRDSEGSVFIFLSEMTSASPTMIEPRYIIYISGPR